MTYRQLTKDEQRAAVVTARDWFEQRAAYLRRRADTPGERQDAIAFEDMARQLDDVASNLSAEATAQLQAEREQVEFACGHDDIREDGS